MLYNRFNSDIQTNYIINNPFNPIKIKRQFYTWYNNSCRLDSAFFIFTFIFYGYINKKDLKKNNYSYLINNISSYILDLDDEELKKGIWPF